jgi:hypothetical protein
MAGNTTDATIVFIGGERNDTANGKERYTARSNDGREFGIWDRNLWAAVEQHLHEELLCTVGSKQTDNGKWWNTLYALPALGIQAADTRPNQPGSAPAGAGLDYTVMLDRIATALENLLSFQTERYLADGNRAMADDDEPPE